MSSFSDNVNCFNVSNISKVSNVSNVTNVSNVSNHYTLAYDRSEILIWLSPLEPHMRYQDIQNRRADNVGEWLLRTDEFQRWCKRADQEASGHATLFCRGDPAVGKTYLSSLVVDRLCDNSKEENTAVACFYVDFAARDEQTPTNMLGSLLKQIVGGLERIPDEIIGTFHDYKKVIGGRRLQVPEIITMFQTVASLQPTFICIDALDECLEGYRSEVLNSLRQILEKSPNMRIFLTGRRHIRGEIERHLGRRTVVLCVKRNNDDIIGYVRMRLGKDTSFDAMDSVLEAEIITGIAENTPETFLLISLTMDAILGEPTASGRRQKLRALTDGLDLKDVYGATLERIKEQGGEKSRLGMAALMWISHSERLLELDDLLHALTVEIGSTGLDSERIPSVETLLSCCLGLVVIDKEASIVRLIHFTLHEYLHTCSDLFGAPHSIMAQTCLTYLNFRTIKDISPALFAPPHSTPFLEYSSLYWGAHARRKPSGDVVSLALKLFSQVETHISTKLLSLDIVSRAGRCNRDMPIDGYLIGFTGLHCASIFGIVEVANALMDHPNCDLNKRDFLGITPLVWAAICGHEEVAKLLLERQTILPDKPDKSFHRTPLSWAAGKGHKEMVGVLLGGTSAMPNGTNGLWAGAPRVMMNVLLGKRYLNPNWPDKYGQAPLSLASEAGHEGVVKLLLARKDVKPDTADGYGRTPLLLASSNGHEGVARLLVGLENVNIDRADKRGETLVISAADGGHSGVVGLLLERKDVKFDMVGKYWRTLILLAAKKGRGGVMKLLLGREEVKPDIRDTYGRTPLSWAAANGHDGVVKQLLGREDVNTDMPDNDDQTPLSWAARDGRNEVVQLLLERGDVTPDMRDSRGWTPLSWAARNGRTGVVKQLLGREDVSPDMPDIYGLTPLSLAALNGHNEVVKLLLGLKDVILDKRDIYGETPLSLAAGDGHNGVVKLLLGREGVNPNMRDTHGQTPLSWAARKGHNAVVKQLLGWEGVNPDMRDNYGQTPLLWAARMGYNAVVKQLLEWEGVNPDMQDNYGQTPLSWAARMGHSEVVKQLLGWEGVNPSMRDNHGQTPLTWAAGIGHNAVVKQLLGWEGVNPDTRDNYGQTPLSWAARMGHNEVVKRLLGREDVNPNIPNQDGLTPLALASKEGRTQAVKLLQAQISSSSTAF